jgi:hypothetical protein
MKGQATTNLAPIHDGRAAGRFIQLRRLVKANATLQTADRFTYTEESGTLKSTAPFYPKNVANQPSLPLSTDVETAALRTL